MTASAEDLKQLTVAGHMLEVEVAATPEARELGLMFRKELPETRGMLFVFDEPQVVAMWMKNTFVDLDVAFIDVCGRVLNIERMQAQSLRLHWSEGPAAGALEVRAGWFAKRGLSAGLVIGELAQDDTRCAKTTD